MELLRQLLMAGLMSVEHVKELKQNQAPLLPLVEHVEVKDL